MSIIGYFLDITTNGLAVDSLLDQIEMMESEPNLN